MLQVLLIAIFMYYLIQYPSNFYQIYVTGILLILELRIPDAK